MDRSLVPFPGARLSELMATKCAYKELQVDVSLVVDNQTCALCERLVADGTVGAYEHASKMLHLANKAALNRDLNFLVCAFRKYFEACVVWPTRHRRRSRLRSSHSISLLVTSRDDLVCFTNLRALRLCHCLHYSSAVYLCVDLDSFETAQVCTFLLLHPNMEYSRLWHACWLEHHI